jgi:hypothetical protein|tara:strand:+ start:1262 stop:2140 length:879 start_codon:yes stop_codon:yes gene_type:complete
MEDQTTEKKVGKTYEDKLADERQGIDISMPDVEIVSKEVPVDENMEPQGEGVERTPSIISDEGNEEEVNYATDWENESRKFQSMYDKQKADYDSLQGQVQNLEPLKQLQSVLESRPDVVQAIQERLEGKPASNNEAQSAENSVDESSFDPWEAYYKPESPSYKLRVDKEKALVNEAVSEQMAGIQSQVAMQNLKSELKSKYDMTDDNEIDQFINFAMTPREQLPVDFLINVYKQFYNKGTNAPSSENIQAVADAQAMPRSAGVLQGGDPQVKSEVDVSWDRILKAGNSGRLL